MEQRPGSVNVTGLWVAFVLSSCLLSPVASADEGEILIAGQVDRDKYWKIKKTQKPFYPPSAIENGIEGCAAAAFIIEPNGSTSNRKIIVSEPPDTFESPILMALNGWKFKATRDNKAKQPVYTWQVISFSLKDGEKDPEQSDSLGEACAEKAREAFAKFGAKQ